MLTNTEKGQAQVPLRTSCSRAARWSRRTPFPLPLAAVDSHLPLPAFPFPFASFSCFSFLLSLCLAYNPESSGSFPNALPLLQAVLTRVVPRSRARDSLATGPHGQGVAVALGQPSVTAPPSVMGGLAKKLEWHERAGEALKLIQSTSVLENLG